MAPVCYARDPHLVPLDAVFDFRRARAKVGNKPNGVKWLRYLEGKGAIDEVYKNILLHVLTVDERPCPGEVKIETADVVEPRRRPVAPESRKRKSSFADQHNDRGEARSSEDNEAQVPSGNDLLHQKRVKEEQEEHERPCPPEVKIETDDVVEPSRRPVAPESRKRKSSFVDQHDDRGEARSSEDNEAQVPLGNERLHQKRVKEEQEVHEAEKNMEPEYFGKHLRLAPCDAISDLRYARGRVGSEPDGVGRSRLVEGKGAMNEGYKNILLSLTVDERRSPRKVKIDTYEEDFCEPRKSPVAPKNRKRKYSFADEHDDRGKARISVDNKAQVPLGNNSCHHKKVKEENQANKKTVVKKENKNTYQGRGSRENLGARSYGQAPLREKAAFGYCAVKKEPDHCVVILDSDKVINKEITSPFVCAKRYHSSMAGEGFPSAAASEFRRELFEVLKKPYDKEEYKKSREAIRAGSYHVCYPGLQSKLTKYRYKRNKLMIIVRGFLFWLQNLTREGSFRPWKDRQCLKLELPSR